MTPYATEGWEVFFTATAGAAAALAGLVFVSLSINLERILKTAGVSGRAAEGVIVFAGGLLVSLLVLIPGQTAAALALELLASGLVLWLVISRIHLQAIRTRLRAYPMQVVPRVLFGQLATLPVILAAVTLFAGTGGGLDWLVLAVFFAFVAGLTSSWVLLIEILR